MNLRTVDNLLALAQFHKPPFIGSWLVKLSLLLALVALAGAAPAFAQEDGRLEGTVMHAGTNEAMTGLPVFLSLFDGFSVIETRQGVTADDGSFVFEGLNRDPGFFYVVRTLYAGVEYPTSMLSFRPDTNTLSAALTVYEAGEDDSGIFYERVHLIFQVRPEVVQVGHMVQMSNASDEVYLGQPLDDNHRATIRVYLPREASAVTFESQELAQSFVPFEGGVAHIAPIRPGRGMDQILLSYSLPPQQGAWSVDYRFDYPVTALNVLVEGEEWDLSSGQLTFAGRMGGEVAFKNYAAGDLPAGQVVTLTFTPSGAGGMAGTRPAMTVAAGGSLQSSLIWVAAALGGLLLLFLLSYPALRGYLVR